MGDPLDDRLAELRDAPLSVAAPETVRARGERRRAQARAAAAGAAALALIGVLSGIALGIPQSAGSDSLRPAPFGSQAPAPSRQPVTAVAVDPAELLDPEAVARVRGGAWTPWRADEESTLPDLHACPEGPAHASHGLRRVLQGPEPLMVTSQVLAHPDGAAAAAAWQALVDDVERCPRRAADSEDGRASASYALAGGVEGSGADRVYGSATSRDCDGCAERGSHFSLSRVGSRVVLVWLNGAALEELPPLADAAEHRVRCAGDACAAPLPSSAPARSWALADAFLSPTQAGEAEGLALSEGRWRTTDPYEPDPAPLADPCGEGTVTLPGDVRESGERAMGSSREHGGSGLTQEVYRYSSSVIARDAYLEYAERYVRCSEVQDPNGPAGSTIRSAIVESGGQEADRLLVRRVPCQDGVCADQWSTYVMLARAGDALVVAGYTIAEDGDPREEAERLLLALHDHLREVAGT